MQIGQLGETADHVGKLLGLRIRQGRARLIDREGGEFGQRSRVQRVGSGKPPGRLAKGAGAVGVDPAQRRADFPGHAHQHALIAAGRLADHIGAVRPRTEQGGFQRSIFILHPPLAAIGVGEIDPVLRNVHADKSRNGQERVWRKLKRKRNKRLGDEALAGRRGRNTPNG
jgi:hypothetical protein